MSIEVSTITPCYKMKDYIEIFLERLSRQTFFNRMEVVLDHNEPEKGEVELVRKFQKRYPGRLKHIIVKKVDPIGTSMNRCIHNAKGKFLTIWNVDDLRTDNSIEVQYNQIKRNEKIGFVYGNYTIVKEFGSSQGKFIDHKNFDKSELTKSMILGPFFMFKKSLCKKIGFFDEQLLQGADFDFAIRLALASNGRIVYENLGYYLNAQKGLSTKPNSLQPIEKDLVCMRYGIFEKIERKNIPYFMNYEIKSFLNNKKFLPIKKFYKNYDLFIKKKIYEYKNKWKIF
jgi:glycosyltransferase involved in cell wall biosynthesis